MGPFSDNICWRQSNFLPSALFRFTWYASPLFRLRGLFLLLKCHLDIRFHHLYSLCISIFGIDLGLTVCCFRSQSASFLWLRVCRPFALFLAHSLRASLRLRA